VGVETELLHARSRSYRSGLDPSGARSSGACLTGVPFFSYGKGGLSVTTHFSRVIDFLVDIVPSESRFIAPVYRSGSSRPLPQLRYRLEDGLASAINHRGEE